MPLSWGFLGCFKLNTNALWRSSKALLPIKPFYLNRYRRKETNRAHHLYILLLLDLLRLSGPSSKS
jgi:hypothetical protein